MEIWQTNAGGRYRHWREHHPAPLDPNFDGIGRAITDAAGRLWFAPSQRAAMARVQRLRAGFGLNYAAIGLVTDLLDRIAVLEAAARGHSRRTGG